MSDRVDEATRDEGESRFRALVEGFPGAVYRRAPEPPWGFHYVSDAVEPIAGYRSRELTGSDAVPGALAPEPEDLAAVSDAIRLAASSGQPYDVEYRVRHADGTVRWVHDRGQPERNATGAVAWINGVLFDVTERKRVERGLEEQQARLLALMASIPDHV